MFAQTREELSPMYTKLNTLMSQVYPDYSPESKLMRGSVVKLTIGDYIYRMSGFLDNVNITIDNSTTPWEIQLYGALAESDVAQVPHIVTVACQFTPIFDLLPSRVTNTNQLVPLIGNVKGNTFLQTLTPRSNTPSIETPNYEVTDFGQFSTNTNPNEVGADTPGIEPEQVLTNKQQRRVAARNNAKAKRDALRFQRLQQEPGRGNVFGTNSFNRRQARQQATSLSSNTGG